MKKLTKTEIRALAEKIREPIIEEKRKLYNEEKKKLLEEFESSEYFKMMKILQEQFNLSSPYSVVSQGTILEKLGFKMDYFKPSLDSVERELIVTQLENESLSELINNVTNKFRIDE